ncbi:cell division protein ZapE [Gordonia crocea]|uniref:Cell division protein ZapE n=1 Tax=Gordonia crocea TaxID=589162 RepID=A0A7I9UV87_9ACTN|nr:cell division protein ZapE [Gordonia crocea]GED96863.1 cell division protein ZapE [Gordonia crocea]
MRSLRRRQRPTVTADALIAVVERSGFSPDPAQRAACAALAEDRNTYLVGPAGRGKTALLDAYVASLPAGTAVRAHWHEFIRDLHVLIGAHGGLDPALEAFLGSAAVLCFDELHVDDPADGIFLRELIERVGTRGIRLVVTSNDTPDALMPNPLFHETFLPTIEFIKHTCSVVELDSGIDYRSLSTHRIGFDTGRWLCPPPGPPHRPTRTVTVGSRSLPAWAADDNHLGVGFDDICGRPLGATDYLALARSHRTWTISDVPDLTEADREAAQRFVHLVDVLYDQAVPTTITSTVPRERFARAGRLPTGAARMRSRLSTLR